MKKVGIVIFAAALIAGIVLANIFSFGRIGSRIFNVSMNFGGVRGSGNVITEKRELVDFNAVDVGGIFNVEITAQKDFSVEIETDDNLVPIITTEVVGGVLKIETSERIKSHGPINIRVSAPDIENIEASGASTVKLVNVSNDSVTVNSSGASKISVAGETQKLTVDVSGASKINTEDLKAVNANIDASGASHVNVFVSGELVTDASGASRITYSGNPANIQKSATGASTVSAK